MFFSIPRPHWEFDYPKGKMVWLVKWGPNFLCKNAGPNNTEGRYWFNRDTPDCLVFSSLWYAMNEAWEMCKKIY